MVKKLNKSMGKNKKTFFFDLSKISLGLRLQDDIWVAKTKSDIFFPSEGYKQCLEIEENSFWFNHRNNCIVNVVQSFPPYGPILDIGGGNGFVSLGLIKNGIDTYLVEPGLEGILNAKKRNLKKLICSSFEDAEFNKNSLPAVGLFDVLEHIEDDISFLFKLGESLIADGRLYLTVPAYNFLWSDEDNYAGHFRRYTLKGIVSKLNSAGFVVEYSTYIFSFPVK
jgi:SAM-dependent methyltransferase